MGRAHIVFLTKDDGGDDSRAKRILDLLMQEVELIKYHLSTCYKKFQTDMEKKKAAMSLTVNAGNNKQHRKRLKMNNMKQVRIICSSDCKAVK